jgi:hypothetical protein
MSKPRVKQHKRYLLYRAYCIGAIVFTYGAPLAWGCSTAMTPRNTTVCLSEVAPLLLIIPISLPALFLLSNLRAFPFDYSVFGPYERTPFPNGTPILQQSSLGGRVGWAYGGITWCVYPSGIGVSVFCAGRAFVPVENIIELRSGFLSGRVLRHNSPELRNPLVLPSDELFEAIQDVVTLHSRYHRR